MGWAGNRLVISVAKKSKVYQKHLQCIYRKKGINNSKICGTPKDVRFSEKLELIAALCNEI